jgi:hypothetical protein
MRRSDAAGGVASRRQTTCDSHANGSITVLRMAGIGATSPSMDELAKVRIPPYSGRCPTGGWESQGAPFRTLPVRSNQREIRADQLGVFAWLGKGASGSRSPLTVPETGPLMSSNAGRRGSRRANASRRWRAAVIGRSDPFSYLRPDGRNEALCSRSPRRAQ